MKIKRFISAVGLLCGIASVIIYLCHIVIGGVLWQNYNHMTQDISDLTAMGSPNSGFLNNFTLYSKYLALILSITLLYLLWKHINAVAKAGLCVFCALWICCTFGIILFPYNREGDSFQVAMNAVVSFLSVAGFFGSSIITGIGLSRIKTFKKLGLYSVFSGVIINVASAGKNVFSGIKFPIYGLLDRISVVTFQVWIFIVSIYFLSMLLNRKNRGRILI